MRYTILTYHSVLPQAEIDALDGSGRRYVIEAKQFAEQMDYLRRQRLRVLTFAELSEMLDGRASMPPKAVLITFDDGREDNFRVAFPILAANGLRATFFLVTGRLGQPGYLTWKQAAEMQAAGMEIGSHTVSHPDLDTQSAEEIRRELVASREAIRTRLGREADSLALPYGCGKRVVREFQGLPYGFVCTSRWGYNTETSPPLALKRLPLRHGDKIARFVAFSEVNCAYIRRCQASKVLVHVAKAALGASFYKRLRQMVLR